MCPPGPAVSDFYGADRVGDDLFANCLIALNAKTGREDLALSGRASRYLGPRFSFAPVLLTVQRDGKDVDAVAQTTKQGFVYLFDRTNGAPLFPIENRKYPSEHGAR